MSFLNTMFEWIFLFLGIAGIGGAAFGLIYFNYNELESKAQGGLSLYASEIYDMLDRMFKRRTMNECYVIILAPTIFLGLCGFFLGLLGGIVVAIVGAGLLGYLGFRAPRFIIGSIFKYRVIKFDTQLVDALNMMSSAIRSGLSFLQAIQVIEREMPSPLSDEFGMVLKENRVGVNINDALMNLTKRVPSEDLFMIINSVVTLSQQGGDLSEAFETIAETIRERQRVTEKIKTMSAAALTQALILSALPFIFLALQYFIIDPKRTMLMFTTPLGLLMLAFMLMMMGMGAFVMKKILTVDV